SARSRAAVGAAGGGLGAAAAVAHHARVAGIAALDPALQQRPAGAAGGQGGDGDELGHRQPPPNRPANPMKASDRTPAMRKLIAVPRSSAGTSESSASSRSPAISTS